MENTLKKVNILTPLEITEAGISDKVQEIIEAVENGEIGGDEVIFFAKVYEKVSKMLLDSKVIKQDLISDFDKGKQDYFGHKVNVRNLAQYDYSNSPSWVAQNQILQNAKEELKEIQEKAKVTTNPDQHILTSTGETMFINRAQKIPKGQSVSISIKKY